MANQKAKIIDKTMLLLSQMSIADFLEQLKKYPVVTRKLLLIRPLRLTDQGEVFMNKVADDVKKVALKGNWDIKDLKGNQATKKNILYAIKNKQPDFIMYFGHSYNTYIPGQENNKLVEAITPQNVQVLSGKAVIANACYTAKSVGPHAINAKTRAYIGFTNLLTTLHYTQKVEDDCKEALSVANLALLNGETFGTAWQKGWDTWDQKWKYWTSFCIKNKGKLHPEGIEFCQIGVAALLHNRNRFARLGEKKAVARPIGILGNP